MTSYVWNFGSADAGLAFTVVYDGTNFTVTVTEGYLDLGARAVQRCVAPGVSLGRHRPEENGDGALEGGFPERRNSDSWGGNRGGGCRDRVLTAAGLAGGGA